MPAQMVADYLIVGAGSAGCVVADKLSASGASVILLEAGPRDGSPLIRVPAGVISLMGHPVYDWNYLSAPEPGIGGRQIRLPRGRVLGGTSSTNGMNFVRVLRSTDFRGKVIPRHCLSANGSAGQHAIRLQSRDNEGFGER